MNFESNVATLAAIAGAITALIATVLSTFSFLNLKERSKSRYDDLRHQAILSDMRASFEGQMARLNMQLTATEQRWRDTNHLLINAQQAQPEFVKTQKVEISDFLRELGLDEKDIIADPKLVFMLTPFSKEEQDVYNAVARLCQKYGLRCARGDEDRAEGVILPHIVKLIISARIVIANVSARNPNVFYELGIAHALGKPTILISQTLDDVPFDIRTRRVVLFNDISELDRKLSDNLLRVFADISPAS